MRRAAAVAIALGWLMGADPASAQFYKWTDEQGTTHYTDGLHGVPERYRAKAVLLGYRNSPPPPPGSQPATSSAVTGGATIRFNPGERIMVDAKLNGRGSVRLLLDTGADRTLISPKALSGAGVSMLGAVSGPILGVTGQAEAQGVALDSLEIQDARVTRMPVIAYDMNRPGFDGLLGRDFLERFHVTIDSAAGTVTIRPK
jgi:hypothetical protein